MSRLPPPPGWAPKAVPPPPPSGPSRTGSGLPPPLPPPPPSDHLHRDLFQYHLQTIKNDIKLNDRKRKWLQLQKRRFAEKETGKGTYVHSTKIRNTVLPEHLRKIIRDHGDLSTKKVASDKRSSITCIKVHASCCHKIIREYAATLGTS